MNPAPPPSFHGSKVARASWRRRLPLVGASLLIVLIAIGFWPRPVPVELAPVTRGPLVVTVDEEGMTRVKNRYVVSAPVAGQLRRIDWKAGAPVVAGKTVLAVLETAAADFLDARTLAQAQARVRAAEASRDAALAQQARAEAAAKMFETEFGRIRELRERQVVSSQEFDVAQMRNESAKQELRAAEFNVQVANFELEQARALLTRGQGGAARAEPLAITSPVSGKILRVLQESARVVAAGMPLVEVGDPTDLEVRIEVLSRDGVAIRPGAPVRLEQWGGARLLHARVRLVEPSAFTKISALGVEEQRVYVVADFTDPVAERPTLGDNYRVEAKIVTWESDSVLRAPAGTFFQRGDAWYVFVGSEGKARLRAVKTGHGNGVQTEVLSGLTEGDRVVVYPGDKVNDGTRVAPLDVAAP